MAFKELDLLEASINPFKLIGNDSFLVTSGSEQDFNTMTASWGNLGVMWGKNIFTAMVRPTRHTYKYMEESDYYSISFFDKEYKEILKFCGANSGRDCDKVKETGLIPMFTDEVPYFEQAKLVLICKKIYRSTVNEERFIDNSLFDFYKTDTYHVAFIGEIIKAYIKE